MLYMTNSSYIFIVNDTCHRLRTLGSNLSHFGVGRSLLTRPAGGLDLDVAVAP
jgi:hypothetical protein